MKVTLLCIGKTNEKYLTQGIDLYQRRLKHYVTFDLQIIKDVKAQKAKEQLMRLEAEAYLQHISPDDTVILLDEIGKPFTSVGFAGYLEKHMIQATRRLVFVIGGAYGFDDSMRQRADASMSMSAMTFSHQMIRLFFVEQLYRAFTIIRNEKYHNP